MASNDDKAWAGMSHLMDFPLTSFLDATAVKPSSTNPNLYIANVKRDWCIGLVPHGGYLASLLTHTVSQYFKDQQAARDQPDLITLHIEFLSRTAIGHANILITPLKLGGQFSNVRVQLLQPDAKTSKDRVCIEALVTQGNLTKESQNGQLSLTTLPLVEPRRFPKRESFVWSAPEKELVGRRPAAYKASLWLPPGSKDGLSKSPEGPSIREQWTKWMPENGERFTVESLPFLADAFRPIPENYGLKGNWYPTLNYGVDVKKRRNGEDGKEVGWEWLYIRAEMTEMRNGRFGVDLVILSEDGEVVCTSRHVALILGAERNYKGRGEAKI